MAKITYLLGAGASYFACPILEKQAEMMIEVATKQISKLGYYPFDSLLRQGTFDFINKKYIELDSKNEYKILWYIGYFGEKAKEYGTIDTYARKLSLNKEEKELRLLKMCVSVFFDLWENFYCKDYQVQKDLKFNKIDNRYKALFSVLVDNKNSKIELNNDFKFITWNYDLQLEETFGMFLGLDSHSDLKSINRLLKFKENQDDGINNDIFHLNGHRGFFNDVSTRSNNEELIINLSNDVNLYWKNISDLFESTEKGKASFDNFIKYAWEHNLNDSFFSKISKVLTETEILIIIGYSFPAFNRKIDQFLFSNLYKVKKIIYQDPNATKEMIINLFDDVYFHEDTIIEILSDEKSLKQFHLPNEHFIIQKTHSHGVDPSIF